MEEAFEEGQGPHRVVEPVMMMMTSSPPADITTADVPNRKEVRVLTAMFCKQALSSP
jgi:hypothetical protein